MVGSGSGGGGDGGGVETDEVIWTVGRLIWLSKSKDQGRKKRNRKRVYPTHTPK